MRRGWVRFYRGGESGRGRSHRRGNCRSGNGWGGSPWRSLSAAPLRHPRASLSGSPSRGFRHSSEPRWTGHFPPGGWEAHHIIHWADGGETRLDNLILLCRHHHRALHEEGFRVRLRSDGTPRFSDRTGWPLPDLAPPTPALSEDPIQTLCRRNRQRGVRPDAWTASSRWKRAGDIPWTVEGRVREVVEG